jgi:hypothetical protein
VDGTVRDECSNMHQFSSIAEACVRLSTFRHHYNTERPHSRLSYLTPLAFKTAWYEAKAKQPDPHIGSWQFQDRMSTAACNRVKLVLRQFTAPQRAYIITFTAKPNIGAVRVARYRRVTLARPAVVRASVSVGGPKNKGNAIVHSDTSLLLAKARTG